MKNLITAWGIKPEKIVVIPNSVDIDLFAPNLSANKSFDLITICRLTPWKGVSELIEESAKKDLSIAIVGSGSEEQSLRVLADKLKAKATFLGEQIQSELPSLINQSKVFVLNSNYEGSPHALLEAMACGAISVARGTTGTNEVIKDGINGFLFGSSRTLGAALDLALNEVGRKSDISTRARALVVDNNDRDQHFIKITNLLREVS
jgi:glycosyltransferase involved in cell wall biosynthesis